LPMRDAAGCQPAVRGTSRRRLLKIDRFIPVGIGQNSRFVAK